MEFPAKQKLLAVALTSPESPLGAQTTGAPSRRRSSAPNSPSKELESHCVPASISDVETFLAGIRFEKRNLLDELPINLGMG